MDLGVSAELRDQDLETDGSSSSVLAHVLDANTNVSTAVNSTCYTSGLAVLTPTLDGHTTVTSLAGFTLNSFHHVDVSVKHQGQEHHDLALATVGVDGRLRFTPASHGTPTKFHHTVQERQNLPTSEADFVSDLSQVEILSGGDSDDRFVSGDDLLHERQVQVAIPDKTATKKKGGWPKGKKRRKTLRDANAPRAPLTAYVQFLNDNREKIRAEHPDIPFPEVTKILGAQWSKMTQDQKQKYLDEAERDKERYVTELESYQQTDAYKDFLKKQEERKRKCTELLDGGYSNGIELCEEDDLYCKPCNQYFNNLHNKKEHIYGRKHLQTVNGKNNDGDEDEDLPSFSIPIFTEEFLDHNKIKESELRQLRKTATEYEDQNSILAKHIEGMKHAMEKIHLEANAQCANNELLQQHLDSLRAILTHGFQDLPLSRTGELPTNDCIDNYMTKLYSLILDSPQENEGLIGSVRDIMSRLGFQNDDKILTPT